MTYASPNLQRAYTWYVTLLFWAFALLLSAGGHRLYVGLRSTDYRYSSTSYQRQGTLANWLGHGTVEQSLERKRLTDSTFEDAAHPSLGQELRVLPISAFWVSLSVLLTIASAVAVWAGQWSRNNGMQSLVGALAGHALWLGAVEIGLDLASRRLGIAGSLSVIQNRVVGVHGGSILIQLSAVFLIPVLIGLTLHESNRCVVFGWFRQRVPLTKRVAASGRVDNYAARTLIQFFMTVWVCYVGVLWIADRSVSPLPSETLLVTLIAIALGTPYMIYCTTRQKSTAAMFRYSISGAIVSWSGIEIASATGMITEPWLSDSLASLWALAAATLTLLILTVVVLARPNTAPRSPSSNSSDAEPRVSESGSAPSALQNMSATGALFALLALGMSGCNGQETAEVALTNANLLTRLDQLAAPVHPIPAEAMDGIEHALASTNASERVAAILACGKSRSVSIGLRKTLMRLAATDADPLVRGASLRSLHELGRRSDELRRLTKSLRSDPVLGKLATQLDDDS